MSLPDRGRLTDRGGDPRIAERRWPVCPRRCRLAEQWLWRYSMAAVDLQVRAEVETDSNTDRARLSPLVEAVLPLPFIPERLRTGAVHTQWATEDQADTFRNWAEASNGRVRPASMLGRSRSASTD